MLEHSHLAIEFYNFKFWEAPSVRKAEFEALSTPGRTKPVPRSKRHKSLGTRKKPLEQRPALASS